jgi:hybrid cluster-associated redox disulfide protein
MITKDMKIGEICRTYPQLVPVLKQFGLDCLECQIADLEELEHGAGVHKVDVDMLLAELNRVVSK